MQILEEEGEELPVEAPSPVNMDHAVPRRCCTLAEVKTRPEIVLWYMGNMLSYLGFYMPFVNLVSISGALNRCPCCKT